MAATLSLRRYLLLGFLLPRGVVVLVWLGLAAWLPPPMPVLWLLIALDGLCLLGQARRVLRHTDAHMQGSGAMALVWGSYLLVLLGGLAALLLWWQAMLQSQQGDALPYAEARRLEREALYRLALSDDGLQIHLTGEITHGLTRRMADLLARSPAVRRLRLSSGGGLIYEARGAAQLIQQHGLETEVAGLCASACTLIFAAGSVRHLASDGQLGFHGYALMFEGGLPQVDLAREQQKDLAFLIARGISAEFAEKALTTPHVQLWQPSREVLVEAGVVTGAEQ